VGNHSTTVVARSSGKLNTLYVKDNQEVKAGEYLAVVDNPAQTKDILYLKEFVNHLDMENDSLVALPDKELLLGNLQSISGESVHYAVEISLPEKLHTTYQKELPYLPNMQGNADIITEDISLLERLIMPVRKLLYIFFIN
jgi:hypothetical protein